MINHFPEHQATFLLDGPAGKLEVLAYRPINDQQRDVVCIICHPHPVHGGTMHNKVVYTVASALHELGIKTVRFNFRGVQKSEGEFAHAMGELEDLLAVHAWVKHVCPTADVWLAGFSFGSLIALKATAHIPEVKQLITVAPPAGAVYFQEVPVVHCPWLLIQGEQDEVIASDTVFDWVATLSQKPTLIKVPEAGHFFHQKLNLIKHVLHNQLKDQD